jgi:hypothetical protein
MFWGTEKLNSKLWIIIVSRLLIRQVSVIRWGHRSFFVHEGITRSGNPPVYGFGVSWTLTSSRKATSQIKIGTRWSSRWLEIGSVQVHVRIDPRRLTKRIDVDWFRPWSLSSRRWRGQRRSRSKKRIIFNPHFILSQTHFVVSVPQFDFSHFVSGTDVASQGSWRPNFEFRFRSGCGNTSPQFVSVPLKW